LLNKTFAYDLLKCDFCEKWIIFKIVDGIPNACPRCGVSANQSLSPAEAENIRRQQEREQFIHNHGNNGQTFFVRRG